MPFRQHYGSDELVWCQWD